MLLGHQSQGLIFSKDKEKKSLKKSLRTHSDFFCGGMYLILGKVEITYKSFLHLLKVSDKKKVFQCYDMHIAWGGVPY